MKTSKLLGMTAAAALLTAPAMAAEIYYIDSDGDGFAETSIENQLVAGATFGELDDNNDGVVTQTEFQNNTILEETATEFALYDTNQDQVITPFELYTNSKFGNGEIVDNRLTVVRSNSGQRIGSLRTKFYEAEPVYVDADADARAEYIALDDMGFRRGIDTSRPLFVQLDTNEDGYISQREFMANTQHDNEAAVFAMLDKNEDEGISPFEFNRYEKTGGVR